MITKKNIQSVRGMHDGLPKDVIVWQRVENILKSILGSYGYNEIRIPIVEFTELFKRSSGTMTDIVEKEMYTLIDHHGNNLALRPEGTAGCVRAGIENSLFYRQEQRLWYLGPMFRHERPQKGRYRQFHQFSAEAFGYSGPDIDVELMLIAVRCWKALGISQYISLEINSIGSLSSRIKYCKELILFLEKNRNNLDNNLINRLYSNPMRILDTKNDKLKKLFMNAPVLNDYLDDVSRSHFAELCQLLDFFQISYKINPYLVRGLDYYNQTVFEWVTNSLGVKKTICAGGRYDDLVRQLGGRSTPAVGFAIGLERVLLLMKIAHENNIVIFNHINIDIYMISLGINTKKYAMLLSEHIREKIPSVKLMTNHGNGDLKKQLDQANKNNARIILIVRDHNVYEKTVMLKYLPSKRQEVLQYDIVAERLKNIL